MISVEKLKKTYNKRTGAATTVLKELSLSLPDVGFICILGESGCGKTTLMNIMGGLDTFDGGSVSIGEVKASKYGTVAMEAERNCQCGYIFQNYYLLSERSVAHNVYLGLHSLPIGRLEKLKRVKGALEAVGMFGYAKKRTSDLSGGQQQRVAIARALARHPKIIFADEPTGNLDEANTAQVCTLLRKVSEECLVVMVTHERRIAEQYADRIIELEDGTVKSDRQNQALPAIDNGSLAAVLQGQEDSRITQRQKWRIPMLWKEAMQLLWAKGHRTGWLYACLAVLMTVILLTVGDYMTIASIRPQDFVFTDSHLVQVEIQREAGWEDLDPVFEQYRKFIDDKNCSIRIFPMITTETTYYHEYPFVQLEGFSEVVKGFSYVPLEKLDESTLLMGRMPENPEEIVVDRYVAERFMEGNGILSGSLRDISGLLGQQMKPGKKLINFEIVGICENGEMSVYLFDSAIASIGAAGNEVMTLSELKKAN